MLCGKCILRKSLRKEIGDLQEEVIRLRNISDHKKISSMLNEEAVTGNKYTVLTANEDPPSIAEKESLCRQ